MKILRILTLLVCLFSAMSLFSEPKQRERERMVRQQIESRGVSDVSTLRAMRKVPRHLFIPKTYRSYSYADRPVPIGYGQTISQPYIVAIMTESIKPEKGHKILEIGTGSGYQAAVLSEIVENVYTIEIVPELAASATKTINSIGYKNIAIKNADGYYGWEEHAPFDAIVVTAAAEHIPPPLIEQLKDGGKMIIPIGSPFTIQNLLLVEKEGKNIKTTSLMAVRFVPFTRKDK